MGIDWKDYLTVFLFGLATFFLSLWIQGYFW